MRAKWKLFIYTKMKTTKTLEFYKEDNGRWYIDLPEFLEGGFGGKADLEMVAGADDMLEVVGNGSSRVALEVGEKPFDNADILLLKYKNDEAGANYKTNISDVKDVWLCNVTKYVFGGYHPQNIFVNASQRN